MAPAFIRKSFSLILVFCVICAGYFGVQSFFRNPCALPKTFSVGAVDSQFNISKETVELYSKEAAAVWNNSYKENQLLTYIETGGDIQITFIYDERQRTTIKNERLQRTIDAEKGELNSIKETIDSLKKEYDALEKNITAQTKTYNARLTKHNEEIEYWNSRGGAPREDYQRLEREAASLETERLSLNTNIARFNVLVERIKNYDKDHNQVVSTLNEKISTLNKNTLREFEEGTYDPNTRTITIYEYGNTTALKRVLIHELGHALALNHVDDKEAIMYSVNQGKNLTLTKADKEELMNVCREKSFNDIKTNLITIRDGIFLLLKSSWLDRVAPQE